MRLDELDTPALAALLAQQRSLMSQIIAPIENELLRRLVQSNSSGKTIAEDDEWLTAEELAKHLKVAKSWPHEQARLGKLPHKMVGRYRRFRLADVQAALSRNGDAA